MGSKGGVGTRGTSGATNADWVVLREGGRHPGDIVPFVLARARLEEEDSSS